MKTIPVAFLALLLMVTSCLSFGAGGRVSLRYDEYLPQVCFTANALSGLQQLKHERDRDRWQTFDNIAAVSYAGGYYGNTILGATQLALFRETGGLKAKESSIHYLNLATGISEVEDGISNRNFTFEAKMDGFQGLGYLDANGSNTILGHVNVLNLNNEPPTFWDRPSTGSICRL